MPERERPFSSSWGPPRSAWRPAPRTRTFSQKMRVYAVFVTPVQIRELAEPHEAGPHIPCLPSPRGQTQLVELTINPLLWVEHHRHPRPGKAQRAERIRHLLLAQSGTPARRAAT